MKSEVLLNSASRKQNKKRQILMQEENGNESGDKPRSDFDTCNVLSMTKCIKLSGNLLSDSKSSNSHVSEELGHGLEVVPENRTPSLSCDPPLSFGMLTNFQADHLFTNKHNTSYDANIRAASPELSYSDIVHNLSVTSPNFRISNNVHHTDLQINTLDTQGFPGPLAAASPLIPTPTISEDSQNTSQSSNGSPTSGFPYLRLYPKDKEDSPPRVQFHQCRWMHCDSKFLKMDDLVNHVNDQHVKVERPDIDYQCKWEGCPRRGKGFNARYKMLIHIRTHTNEKPHSCALCGKCFSRLENLKIHNRSHTGEKPYICPFEGCNKAYSNSSDRFKHVRTHQEEKPYICKMPGCNKRYTDPSSLRKHVRTHGHYFNGENDSKSSKSKSPELRRSPPENPSPPISSNPSPTSVNQKLYSIPTSCILQQSMPAHYMSPHGIFPSNPMLSSAVLTGGLQSMSIPAADSLVTVSPSSPIKLDIESDKLSLETKCQDGPLDLTTSSPSTGSDVDVGDRDGPHFQNVNSSMHSALFEDE
ncbi:zinc finger protein ZIC 3-like [Saccostrea cucullata]|uniref:zinc finger protein ZIC 3-like n=1 Tax=Saccostrea cuccullata TaxID=36930 RepID=UPI002ED10823